MKHDELRGEIARRRLHAYKVASEANMHPVTLSLLLHGHRPLSDEIAERITRAIDKLGRRARG